ncbi:type II toxin-antitoxin system HicA family toxin [Thioalkalicoccus limnaeus]|uniref:Type II toxin-antitoxin system HicA family toxin n=1 Tax=Thioalkalicoccus limnaeus TaxID=120681 RepID=A0ABV4BB98_9GAMM
MTKRDKRFAALRANPKSVRFEDACRIAQSLVFECQGGQGSHRTYGRFGEPTLLNFQNRGGYIKAYQARQLIEMVDKYGQGK